MQQVLDLSSIIIATEDSPVVPNAIVIPLLANVENMFSQHSLVPTHKWRSFIVIHVLEGGDDTLVRELDVEEQIWDPSGGCAARVVECVRLDHGNEHRRGEGELGVAETGAHFADNIDNGFPWVLSGIGIVNDFLVSGCEVVLPSGVYISWGAVVGSVENQKADVIIISWVCIPVE